MCSPNTVCGYTSSLTSVHYSHNTNIVQDSTPQSYIPSLVNEACPWIQTDNQSGGIDLAEDISARVSNASNLQRVHCLGVQSPCCLSCVG